MRIVIAGGTGFIGQALTQDFLSEGHEIIVIGRDKNKIADVFADKVTAISWDEFGDSGKDIIIGADLIINLAGENIAAKRWSESRKQAIIQSRVQTTQILASGCALLGERSPPLFNASAVGIYGLQKTDNGLPPAFTEDEPIDYAYAKDFVSQIVKLWEQATFDAKDKGVRVVNMRFAVVLDKKGMLAKLKPAFSFGLGGPVGSGNQPFPWVALKDLISAIKFLIKKPDISGPVNFVSPECISQEEFAISFAKALNRPSVLKTPAFLVKILFGEMGEELLLNGQCAYPKVLLDHGYTFKFANIDTALKAIFNQHE